MMNLNKASIVTLLMNNNFAVERALLALYERQTESEQASETTTHRNGQGFASADAEFYSSLAKRVLASGAPKGQRLSPNMIASLRGYKNGVIVRKGITKYAGQLLLVAEERAGRPV